MQRYVHWLAPVITLGVAVYIAIFMIRVNRTDPLPAVAPVSLSSDRTSRAASEQPRWLDAFAQSERQGYFYPVNEIYIDVDLNQKLVNEKIYRLSAKLHDPYQLFCLKQELKRRDLRYSLKTEKEGAELLIYSKDQQRLEALIDTLNNYQITASYLPYKEDQRWKNIK
jgi:hypothetical protein